MGCKTNRAMSKKPIDLYSKIKIYSDTILLGEPFYADFILYNNSGDNLYIEEGGDYRSGRLTSFDLNIILNNGDTLPRKEIWGAMGGRIGFQEFYDDSIKVYEHFIPMWCEITEPGKYILNASKNFRLTKDRSDDYFKTKNIATIKEGTFEEFIVVNDSIKLGRFIDSLTSEIKKETKGRIVEGIGFKLSENSKGIITERLAKNIRKIDYIKDERIIPFLIESYEFNENIPQYKSVYNLTKFSSNRDAFQVLLNAAQTESNSKCFVNEDSISITWTIEDIRQRALIGILKSSIEGSIDFLVSKLNDNFPEERYMLLLVSHSELPFSDAKKLYTAYLNDNHNAVRKKAQELLNRKE